MSDAELAAFEASQDFDALLAQSAREMSNGKTRKVDTPVVTAHEKAGLSLEALQAMGSDHKLHDVR
ncbi:hypothetical protein [Variovorax sp. YR752]|uniref:hypothetical protein n=1 Tax=Variovorax sp. YR752 TaxID=1884383 RepID=UPI0031378D9A